MNKENICIILELIRDILCGVIGILFLIASALIMIKGGFAEISSGIIFCIIIFSLTGGVLVYISITEWIRSLAELIIKFKERYNK